MIPPYTAPALRPCPTGHPASGGTGLQARAVQGQARAKEVLAQRPGHPAGDSPCLPAIDQLYVINSLGEVHFPVAGVVHFANAAR